jgi:hypothetical protein
MTSGQSGLSRPGFTPTCSGYIFTRKYGAWTASSGAALVKATVGTGLARCCAFIRIGQRFGSRVIGRNHSGMGSGLETRNGYHGNTNKPFQDSTTTFIMGFVFHKLLRINIKN